MHAKDTAETPTWIHFLAKEKYHWLFDVTTLFKSRAAQRAALGPHAAPWPILCGPGPPRKIAQEVAKTIIVICRKYTFIFTCRWFPLLCIWTDTVLSYIWWNFQTQSQSPPCSYGLANNSPIKDVKILWQKTLQRIMYTILVWIVCCGPKDIPLSRCCPLEEKVGHPCPTLILTVVYKQVWH